MNTKAARIARPLEPHARGWLLACAIALPLVAQEPSRAEEPLEVVAEVNQEPIFASEVQREVDRVLGDHTATPDVLRFIQARVLDQLIRQRLIVQSLRTKEQSATQAEIDLAIERLERELQQRELSLADHLRQKSRTEVELRRQLEWQLTWQRFLARYVTDENLQSYFERHLRDFDGTRLRVAHILLQPNDSETESAVDRLNEIRQQIVAGELTFADAARQHSTAPTAERGGELGLISRREPMPESFAAAAFALREGEVSQPVVSPFGVHLIQCLAVEVGQKDWQEVRGELTEAVTKYLFQWASQRQWPSAKVTFRNDVPHFAPGVSELAD